MEKNPIIVEYLSILAGYRTLVGQYSGQRCASLIVLFVTIQYRDRSGLLAGQSSTHTFFYTSLQSHVLQVISFLEMGFVFFLSPVAVFVGNYGN